MLYRIRTYVESPRFNLGISYRNELTHIFSPIEYDSLYKECKSKPQLKGVKILKLMEPNDPKQPRELKIQAGKRKVDVNKIPDFWTSIPLPVVTQSCKNYIENADPGIHHFFEFKLYDAITDELYDHDKFYYFICGRILDIDRTIGPGITKENTDMFVICREAHRLQTIIERTDIQEFLETLPIWRFPRRYEEYYANKDFIKKAQKQGLKGFKEIDKKVINRDVQHVWY